MLIYNYIQERLGIIIIKKLVVNFTKIIPLISRPKVKNL